VRLLLEAGAHEELNDDPTRTEVIICTVDTSIVYSIFHFIMQEFH